MSEYCCDTMRRARELDYIFQSEFMSVKRLAIGSMFGLTVKFCPFCGQKLEMRR